MGASADDTLLGDLRAAQGRLFLGHYSADELVRTLAERGFWEALAARGHPDARLALEPLPEGRPRVVLREGEDELGELRASHATWEGHRVVSIDWLEMRDPQGAFTPERPRLPGQRAPGLGIGRRLVELLAGAAARTGAEGIVAIPQHYHNAVLYGRIGFRYGDDEVEGRLRALQRDLAPLPLAAASWAVEEGRVRKVATGERVGWSSFAREQVLPLSAPLRRRVASLGHRVASWRAARVARYFLESAK